MGASDGTAPFQGRNLCGVQPHNAGIMIINDTLPDTVHRKKEYAFGCSLFFAESFSEDPRGEQARLRSETKHCISRDAYRVLLCQGTSRGAVALLVLVLWPVWATSHPLVRWKAVSRPHILLSSRASNKDDSAISPSHTSSLRPGCDGDSIITPSHPSGSATH